MTAAAAAAYLPRGARLTCGSAQEVSILSWNILADYLLNPEGGRRTYSNVEKKHRLWPNRFEAAMKELASAGEWRTFVDV